MKKLLSFSIVSFLFSSNIALAEDCFPGVDDRMFVRQEITLKSEIGSQGEQVGLLTTDDRILITTVKVLSAVQIWAHVSTGDGRVGWLFVGYFGDVIHGRSPICHSPN